MEKAVYTEQQSQRTNLSENFTPFSNMKLVCLISWLLLVVTSLVSFVKPEFGESENDINQIFTLFQIFWFSMSTKIIMYYIYIVFKKLNKISLT
jgi:hypothetical protein